MKVEYVFIWVIAIICGFFAAVAVKAYPIPVVAQPIIIGGAVSFAVSAVLTIITGR